MPGFLSPEEANAASALCSRADTQILARSLFFRIYPTRLVSTEHTGSCEIPLTTCATTLPTCIQTQVNKEIKPSLSHLNLFVGLYGDQSELNLPTYNVWDYSKDQTVDESYAATRVEHERAAAEGTVPTVQAGFIDFFSAKV